MDTPDKTVRNGDDNPGPLNLVGQAKGLFKTVGMIVQAPIEFAKGTMPLAVLAMPIGLGFLDGAVATAAMHGFGTAAAGAVSTAVLGSTLTAIAPAGFILLCGFLAYNVLSFVADKTTQGLSKITGEQTQKTPSPFQVVAATKCMAKSVGMGFKVAGRWVREAGNIALLGATGVTAAEVLVGLGTVTAATGAAATTALGFIPLVGASLATAAAAVSPLALVIGTAVGLAAFGCIAKGVGNKLLSSVSRALGSKQAGNGGPALAPA